MGEEEEKRSHNVKQKKEEMNGCFEVKEVVKLRSEVYLGMSNQPAMFITPFHLISFS